MPRSAEQKIRLLILYDILRKESDADTPLSTNELIEKLNEYGITATRQTIYDDIEMLNAFGYEILCDHGRNNRYFVGDRAFELPEVQILLHAVGASKSLSAKKSAVLTDKIAELLGNVQADKVKDLLTENECEYGNEAIYYSIDTITTALIEKHKLSFLYFDIGSKGERIYRKGKERYAIAVNGIETVINIPIVEEKATFFNAIDSPQNNTIMARYQIACFFILYISLSKSPNIPFLLLNRTTVYRLT